MGKAEGRLENWHGHVTALTVAPQYRRLGLAAQLMSGLEDISDRLYHWSVVVYSMQCWCYFTIHSNALARYAPHRCCLLRAMCRLKVIREVDKIFATWHS